MARLVTFGLGGSAADLLRLGFDAAEFIGADPAAVWNYVLSNGLTAGATLVAVHEWLSELHLIHGLRAGSPLSVAATSRTAGAVEQTVGEAGDIVTVTRV
jgi:hypothetical protein